MISVGHFFGVAVLCVILTLFAYLDRIYRELGRVTAVRLRKNLEIFEAEVEPHLKLERRDAALGFSILTQLSVAFVAVETARGVFFSAPSTSRRWRSCSSI